MDIFVQITRKQRSSLFTEIARYTNNYVLGASEFPYVEKDPPENKTSLEESKDERWKEVQRQEGGGDRETDSTDYIGL